MNQYSYNFKEIREVKVNDLEKLKEYYDKWLSFHSSRVRRQIRKNKAKNNHKENVKKIKKNRSTLNDIFSVD